MEMDKFTLTATDFCAVDLLDAVFINNKGAKFYSAEDYAHAVEYYRLAAAMGNVHAVSNLGYCYLYGRDIEPNTSLATAYFKIAARRGDVDAAYKLGDIYSNDKWGLKDRELSVYYYRLAVSFVINDEWENGYDISWNDELEMYPSLCYAMGRELSAGGSMDNNPVSAYQFLLKAKAGYESALANGSKMYKESYDGVLKLIEDHQFDEVRDELGEENE